MFPGLSGIGLPSFDPITNTTLSIFDTIKQFFTGVNETSVDSFVERLNGVFNSLGGDIEKMTKILTTDWSSTALGNWINILFHNVTYPIGLSLLSLFFIIGYTKRAAMFKMNSFENILKVLLQLFFAKMIMENSLGIMNFILSTVSDLINQVATYTVSNTDLIDFSKMKSEWMKMSYWEFMKMSNRFWPLEIGMMISKMLTSVICYGRIIEVYLFTAMSPIPLSTIASEEYSQIGKRFFQHYASVCLQGLVIIIILKFFPPLVAAITSAGFEVDVWGVMAISLTLLLLLSKAGNIATKLTGG